MHDRTTYAIRRYLENASVLQIAKELTESGYPTSGGAVSGLLDRARRRGELKLKKAFGRNAGSVSVEDGPIAPPTPAMLRLAQFDPVIRRAAELRAKLAA